ncbi:hybrid sensor histidine kinase/response regulator transcription factor [Botryobacter ruber]|uniref:hybrid sensor histidine kinase/response regulator transcription factor n=1 Tax=Botryobacter ruber TaxID=2171629 RepID=UPI000E0A6A16|nr:hybrid sensor histidine kinase/response regulator transcription factor [Botryobacter ruber]
MIFSVFFNISLQLLNRVALIVLLYFFISPVLAQNSTIKFNHLSVDEGLSQSTVFSITKDKDGYMWFGTRDGLNKYDASKVKVYKNNPEDSTSLSNNAIMSLLSDSKGNLWVGSSLGLNLYNPVKDNFTRIKLDTGLPASLSGNHILTIFEDRSANIWVGTRDGLVLISKGNLKQLKRFQHEDSDKNSLVNNEVRQVFQDKEGIIWIGTSNGFSRLTCKGADNYQFTNYSLSKGNAGHKNYNWINAIAEDDKGILWLGTEKTGLKFFNKKEGKLLAGPGYPHEELNSGKIRVIRRDKDSNFWVGSIGGLYVINQKTQHVVKLNSNTHSQGALSDHSIRSMFIDNEGIYWVGTFYGGINYYSPLAKQFDQIRLDSYDQQSKFKVTSKILTDGDSNVWISTEGSGLYYLDRKANTLTNYRHSATNSNSLSHDNIKTIMMEKGGLWIGTLYGLNYFDIASKKFTHYFHQPGNKKTIPDDISYSIKRDSQGTLWVATYNGGLSRFDEQAKTFQTLVHNPNDPTSLSSNSITYIFEDSNKTLWFGTTNGLNRKEPGRDKFRRYLNSKKEEQSLNGNYILCIHEDKKKRLWVSTQNGLNLLNPKTGDIRHFTTADGLPDNTVYGILEDDRGYLWFSTQNGLTKLDPDNFTFQNYNRNDGLFSKEFSFNSFHKDERGYMYFGGFNGVVVFHPDSIQINTKKPKLIFTQLRLYNKEVQVNGEDDILPASLDKVKKLKFRHNQNIFSFEFAVLNYINSNKNQYAYQLAGFDKGWNYVKEPVASYMNLEPGDYTLLIKGSNNDGIWSETQELAITILPPPWKTWWAYTLYAAAFVVLLLVWSGINKTRIKLTHQLELEHLEKMRQEELHQTKINFFANIAHELRTPLTLIVSPVQLMAEKYRNDTFLQSQLKVVTSNTDRLLRLLNQLLDFNKQETGNMQLKRVDKDIVGWLKEIKTSFQEHAWLNHIQLDFHSDYQHIPANFDPEELEKVFYNLMSNSFKFTANGGRIALGVSLESNPFGVAANNSENIDFSEPLLKIVVEDNGIGISPEHIDKIFDRFYQAESPVMSASGFGIGLAFSKEIVHLHGGTISVESQERNSQQPGFTRFTIILPVVSAPVTESPETVQVPAVQAVEQSPEQDYFYKEVFEKESTEKAEACERVSVLVVEDNTEIRSYLKNLLSPHYQVFEATDGEEGWEIATEQLPNLIISDISMPRMDGLELTNKLKTDERTNHIPVILLTARGTIIHQVAGLERGADEYMCKPFNIQLLLLKVKNLLAVREKLKEKYGRIVTLQPQYQEIENPDDKFLQRLMQILEANISDPEFNVSELVNHIGMSRPVLFRKTKMLTGLSVIDLIRSVRLKKAEMLLRQNRMTISEVAYEVGYNDPKYFSKLFRNQYGKTPTEYVELSRTDGEAQQPELTV